MRRHVLRMTAAPLAAAGAPPSAVQLLETYARLDLVEPVSDRVEVGEDQVDARVVLLREEDAAVDDQQPLVVLEDGHVATDLAEPAERDDP